MTDVRPALASIASKRRSGMRYFFASLSVLFVGIAIAVFVPTYLDFASGKRPIAGVVQVHALLMSSWLALFVAQAVLASTGRIAVHRKVGTFGIALGFVVWASMDFVEMRKIIVGELPTNPEDLDWELLPGVYCYTMFLLFFVSAVSLRHKPAWHKRLMLFATFIALQAVEQRMGWLPHAEVGYWSDFLYIDICLLVPLLAYDWVTAKQVHAATLTATATLFAAQAAVLITWGNESWHRAAMDAVLAIRAAS
jgi:hypothetical protein